MCSYQTDNSISVCHCQLINQFEVISFSRIRLDDHEKTMDSSRRWVLKESVQPPLKMLQANSRKVYFRMIVKIRDVAVAFLKAVHNISNSNNLQIVTTNVFANTIC